MISTVIFQISIYIYIYIYITILLMIQYQITRDHQRFPPKKSFPNRNPGRVTGQLFSRVFQFLGRRLHVLSEKCWGNQSNSARKLGEFDSIYAGEVDPSRNPWVSRGILMFLFVHRFEVGDFHQEISSGRNPWHCTRRGAAGSYMDIR